MSPREEAQQRLVEHLEAHADYWTAPYGIIPGMHRLPRGGQVRNVTFGVSRWLDAHATIWSANRIDIDANGALADRVHGSYESVDALIAHLERLYP